MSHSREESFQEFSSMIRRQLVASGTVKCDEEVAAGTEKYLSGIMEFVVKKVLQDAATSEQDSQEEGESDNRETATQPHQQDTHTVTGKRPRIGPKDILKAIAANINIEKENESSADSLSALSCLSDEDEEIACEPPVKKQAVPVSTAGSEVDHSHETVTQQSTDSSIEETLGKFTIECNISDDAEHVEECLKNTFEAVGIGMHSLSFQESSRIRNYWSRWPEHGSFAYLHDVATRAKCSLDLMRSCSSEESLMYSKVRTYAGLAQCLYAFSHGLVSEEQFTLLKESFLNASLTDTVSKGKKQLSCLRTPPMRTNRRKKEIQKLLNAFSPNSTTSKSSATPSSNRTEKSMYRSKWDRLRDGITSHCGADVPQDKVPVVFMDSFPELVKLHTEDDSIKLLPQYLEAIDKLLVSVVLRELAQGRIIFVCQPWHKCEKNYVERQYNAIAHALIAACKLRTFSGYPKVTMELECQDYDQEVGGVFYRTTQEVQSAHKQLLKGARAWESYVQSKLKEIHAKAKTQNEETILHVYVHVDENPVANTKFGQSPYKDVDNTALPISRECRRVLMRHLSDHWCHIHLQFFHESSKC